MKANEFPPLFEAADAASNAAQRRFLVALAGNLVSLIAAAIFSVLNLPTPWFALSYTLILLLSLILTIYLEVIRPQQVWYSARALAESLKTISWRFMMRAEPFESSDIVSRKAFVESGRKILKANAHASTYAVSYSGSQMIPDHMLQVRALSLRDRKQIYQEQRIDDQRLWYQQKSHSSNRSRLYWSAILIGTNAFAIISAAYKIVSPGSEHVPTDILIAMSAAILAWVQTRRFHELTSSYTLTAHEIILVNETMPIVDDERSFSLFVADAENAFSREHTQWQARRDI